jgi:trypsin
MNKFLLLFVSVVLGRDPKTCSTKIVGGNELSPEFSHSWIGVLSDQSWGGLHFCGASLISPLAAITAAHCVTEFRSYDLYFHRHNESRAPMVEGAVFRTTDKVVRHPRYEPFRGTYDFALLLWAEPVSVHQVRPVRLFFGNRSAVTGLYTTSAGWGATSETGPQSDVLRAVSGMELWSLDACEKALEMSVHETMICAGGQAGRDACQGDSGGPLWIDNTDLLVGCVSWGIGCARAGLPGVYSFVPAAEAFVREYVDLPY